MTTNVNGNSWSSWNNDLDTTMSAVNTIDQELKDMQNGSMTVAQYGAALTLIQNAINSMAKVGNSPLVSQFVTGAQTAFNQITCTQGSIKDP